MKMGSGNSAASGGGYVKKNYFSLKDGTVAFRIIPGLGDLADREIWNMYYKVHYGYKNAEGKLRPFESSFVQNFKTKMVEVPDAALERIEKMKAAFEEAKKTGNHELAQKLDKLVGQKGQYNLDKKYYMNVIDEAGKIGVLKIGYKAMLALKATLSDLEKAGVKALSATDGRFLTFTRSGTGRDTLVQVGVKKQKKFIENVGEVEIDVKHAITPDIVARLATEAEELDKLFVKLTAQEIEAIVKSADIEGKSSIIDSILDGKKKKRTFGASVNNSTSYSDEEEDEDDSSANSTTGLSTATAEAQAPVFSSPAPVQAAAPTAPAPTVQVAQAAPVSTPAAPTQAPAPAVGSLSNAEFLKSIGLDKI